MTATHKYAQVLHWIADGKKVRAKAKSGKEWAEFPWDFNSAATDRVLKGLDLYDEYEFQLAPDTIMIGDVECEAPITEWRADAWAITTAGHVSELSSFSDLYAQGIVQTGFAFATKEAAQQAINAMSKLMNQRAAPGDAA